MDETMLALEESLKLQSHYAKLLNQYDGEERRGFGSAEAWIKRLREVGTLPPNKPIQPITKGGG